MFITSQARARQLLKAGYKTLSSLAWADAGSLVTQIDHLSKRQAHQIVSAAKVKPPNLNVWIIFFHFVLVSFKLNFFI